MLVKPTEIEKTSASGIILHAPTEQDRVQLAQCFGQVVDIGPIAWKDEGVDRCKLGVLLTLNDLTDCIRYVGSSKTGKSVDFSLSIKY